MAKESQPRFADSPWMKTVASTPVENPPEPDPASPPSTPNAPPVPAANAAPAVPPVVAAAPPEPPKADPKTSEEKVPRTSREWEDFKTKRDARYKELEGRIAEAEAKLKAAPVIPPEYESAKKQAEEYGNILQQISVENHPRFKAYYDGAITSQVNIAKQIVGAENSAEIERILAQPESPEKLDQLQALVGDLPPIQQSRIGGVLNQLDSIKNERAAEIQKSRENYKVIQQQEEAKRVATRKSFEDGFSRTVEQLKGRDGNPAFQLRDGDEEWNKGVNERIAVAKAYLFDNQPPEQLIQAAINAAAYPSVLKQMSAQMTKITELERQIAAMSAASPNLGGERRLESTAHENGEQKPAEFKPGSRPMEVAGAWFKGLPKIGS
jgi:hypothetical protein